MQWLDAFHLIFLLTLSSTKIDVVSFSPAAAFYGFRWQGREMNRWENSHEEWNTQSHLRVWMITLTHSGGPRQSSVKLGHEAERWHTAVFCPHSIHIHTFYSCRWSGAIGSGHQMPNMLSIQLGAWWQKHARHKHTPRQEIHPAVGILLYYYHKRTHGKGPPISLRQDKEMWGCIFWCLCIYT